MTNNQPYDSSFLTKEFNGLEIEIDMVAVLIRLLLLKWFVICFNQYLEGVTDNR